MNPYDTLHYPSFPIEWTAPERLALASAIHGGPRPSLDCYRVLELGCGNGANLLPLAFYRRHASFVGVDNAVSQIEIARSRSSSLRLGNIDWIHSDFASVGEAITGEFDYIIAHGVFSWIPSHVRDALLQICARKLRKGGLVYLNYNSRPGWNIRGMIREFFLAQTASENGLLIRAEEAQEVSARLADSLEQEDHPYSRLMADEFRFVAESHPSFVAHEYLAEENHAYWRSEFLDIIRRYKLEYVADADFNYSSGRIGQELSSRLKEGQIFGRSLADTVDLLSYRQLHSPILTMAPLVSSSLDEDNFAALLVASCMRPCEPDDSKKLMFEHPSGYRVEAKEETIASVLTNLHSVWPRGLRVGKVCPSLEQMAPDLRLLHCQGLIELRLIEPSDFGIDGHPLNALECAEGGYLTTAYHTREQSVTSDIKHLHTG